MRKKIISKTACFLALLALFQTPAFSASAVINLPQEVRLNGVSYIPVSLFSSAHHLDYAWDPVLKNAVLSGPGGKIKLHVGSAFILAGDDLVRLNEKTRWLNGDVLIPYSASPYLEKLEGQGKSGGTLSAPVSLPQALAHRIRRVVIDPGHGGRDYGAISPYGPREKEVVLDLARAVAGELESRGLEVILTRHTDVFIPLQNRANIANKKKADLFISIHANASRSRKLNGFEVYYLSEATDDEALALERAENSSPGPQENFLIKSGIGLKAIVWDLKESENRRQSVLAAEKIVAAVDRSVSISDKRIRSAGFYVLKWTECPAVLVETGYLTNREDQKRLRNPLYRKELASAIVRGLGDYITEYEQTDGFTR